MSCDCNRHRPVADGTIMSSMLVHEVVDHGLLHLHAMNNWKQRGCGGGCSSCGDVDLARAKSMAKRAVEDFKLDLTDHDIQRPRYPK